MIISMAQYSIVIAAPVATSKQVLPAQRVFTSASSSMQVATQPSGCPPHHGSDLMEFLTGAHALGWTIRSQNAILLVSRLSFREEVMPWHRNHWPVPGTCSAAKPRIPILWMNGEPKAGALLKMVGWTAAAIPELLACKRKQDYISVNSELQIAGQTIEYRRSASTSADS